MFTVLGAAPHCLPGGPAPAAAHEVRPGYLELRETAPGVFRVLWKKPARGDMILKIDPVFPDGCAVVGIGSETIRGGAYVARATLECEGGLTGKTIEIAGLETTLTDVLVKVYYANGLEETHLVHPNSTSAVIGGPGSVVQRIGAYARLGIQHIALGVDHLLFVLGLLLIVSSPMVLLKTITSFTLAHSITLGIATLGFANAPALPLNAVIALSILFLGPEIVRVWRGETSFTIRHPWVVAFAFGLLHGFGFASGLTAMGLPQTEIPLALLFFNVGVELGQLAFVLFVLALIRSFRTLEIRWPRWAQLFPGYAVGTLGAFWFIQRTVALLGGM
ncbi:MAG: HupE/UreJ family protein [Gemmatimonadetes bacterium]|nr:HupE/UreJ family protein [Gemmatimonadota bacterium]